MKKIFLIITICCSAFFAAAQRPDNTQQKEQLETEKINFFTQKIGLTLEQNPKFWALYNDFKKKQDELRKKDMLARKKGAAFTQDAEYAAVIKEICSLEKERYELKAAFHKEIENVLSPKQVFLFFEAEKQYKSLLMRKINNINKGKNTNTQTHKK